MALSANTVWEVRTTGSNTNGGGFVTGSGGMDYSQQDAPQLSVTDGVCSGNTTLTSATGGFTAAMVGNIVYLSSGPGWYQIVARTDTNTVTLDRAGPNATGMTTKVGGALAGVKVAYDASAARNRIWVRTGTYTENDTINIRDDSTPTYIAGYGTNRGDRVKATLRRVSGTSRMIGQAGNYASVILEDLVLDCNSLADYGAVLGGFIGGVVRRCEVKGYTTSGLYVAGSQGGSKYDAVECLVHSGTPSSGAAIFLVNGASAIRCTIRDFYGAGCCSFNGNFGGAVQGCRIYSGANSSADAVFIGAGGPSNVSAMAVLGNVIRGVRHGVNIDQSQYLANVVVRDNVFSVCSGYGVTSAGSALTGGTPGVDRNGFHSCTSGSVNATHLLNENSITLTADPFVDAANGDFNLNNVTGGGALLRAVTYNLPG